MNPSLHHIFIKSQIANHNLICVHGLLGSSRNFQSILKVPKINDHVNSYSIDLRNHGKSFHNNSMSSLDMATDLHRFIHENKITENLILMGHSLGGIVVSTLVSNFPDIWDFTKGVILIDISPKNDHLSRKRNVIRTTLEKLAYYNPIGKPYKQIKEEIQEICDNEKDVSGLVMTNIKGSESLGYSWASNIYALSSEYINYINALEKHICPIKLKLIYGKESRYIPHAEVKAEMFEKFYSNFEMEKDFVGIENAGHWVHAQKPYEFIDTLGGMLKEITLK